jgi:hypothetical protein
MKKTLSISILLFVAIIIVSPGRAEATPGWVTIAGFMDEFSFHIPEGYFAYRNKDSGQMNLSSYKDKVSINISISGSLAPKNYLIGLEDKYDPLDCKYDYNTSGLFSAKIFTCDGLTRFYKTIHLAAGSRYYKMTIGADSPNNVNISLFLMALRLHGRPIFPQYNEPLDKTEKVIWDKGLKNDPLVEQYLKTGDNDNIRVTTPKPTDKAALLDGDSPIYSRDLVIIRRKTDKWLNDLSKKPLEGHATLRVHFLASGRIDKVDVLANSGWEYTQKTIDQLKEWRFVPAQIDGKDVDCSKILEFDTHTI